MKLHYLTIFLCLLKILPSIYCAKILGLFSYPGKSHFDFFRPLFLGLAKAGHQVTVLSYFPNKQPVANYTDLVLDGMPIIANIVDLKDVDKLMWTKDIKLPLFYILNSVGLETCEKAFESKALKNLLAADEKYDVVLTEFFVNDCMLAVNYKLNAPVIGLTSHAPMPWHYKRMGNPFVPSFMPHFFLHHSNQMSFYQRLNNVIHQQLFTFMHDFFCQRATNKLIRKYLGDSIPPIQDLVLNVSAMLINQHFSLNEPMPYIPGFVEVAGLHIQEPKPLDPEIKELLDNAKNGAIYVSWGSMVRPETLSDEKKNALVNALSQFDQLVLLKWPNTSIPNPPKNFYIRDWMPQREILCHPNLKVFMSHGGLLGTTEGIHCGAAIVATPFFGDQFLNAAAIKARNAGVVLPYGYLQEENIVEALRTALSPSVQESAKFISEAFRNRPEKPLDLAIWWVENVIRTKGAQLAVNASSRMSWVAYHNLDVYAALLVIFAIIIFNIGMLIKMLRRSSKTKPKQKGL